MSDLIENIESAFNGCCYAGECAAALRAAAQREDKLRRALCNLIEAYISNVDKTRVGGFYLDPETEDVVVEARAALSKQENK